MQIKIEIAEIVAALTFNQECFLEILNRDYYPFFSEKFPRIHLELETTDEIHYVQPLEACLTFEDDLCRIREEYLDGFFDFRTKKGGAKINLQGLPWALSAFIRNVFTLLLIIEDDAFVFHASAVLKGNKVYIFNGRSGSGKTTISRLSKNCIVLSDDHAVVKKTDDNFFTYATPCWQDYSFGEKKNTAYNIGAIFKLVQDKEAYLKKINKASAITELFTIPHIPAEFLPFERIMDNYHDLLEKIPFYELHFTKDDSFWRCIDAVER
ncbi:MAG: hypothetical protein NC923_00635 [Candidatus Omnitrophica bacterium]|nr:hypothetical protein [Candidatus Omnitrophota bacterium]